MTERGDINENKMINNDNNGSCLSNFIKKHPYIFYGIIVGAVVIAVVIILLCVVLTKKEKEKEVTSNTDIPETTSISSNIDSSETTSFTSNTDSSEIIPTTSIEENSNIFPLDENSNLEVMNVYNNIGDKDDGSLDDFCEYLSQNSANLKEKQKVYLVYYYITENIEFYFVENNYETTLENIFIQKKAVSVVYYKLFRKLLSCMGYPESKIKDITGIFKGSKYSPFVEPVINHIWSAVEINGKWCLIDTAFDAEGSDKYYLCMTPKCFVRNHFPQDPEYQFLENPISFETFHQLIDNAKGCSKYSSIEIIEDKAIQNLCGKGEITIKFLDNSDIPDNHLTIGSFSDQRVASQYWNLPPPSFFLNRIDDGYEIDISVNAQGYFALSLGINDGSPGIPGTHLGGIYFHCEQEPTEKVYYPVMMLEYYKSNIKLISPMQKDLTKGQRYNFELETDDFEELFIKMGGEVISMSKNGNIFKEDNVFIHGTDYIYISPREGFVLRYECKGDDVDFPKCYNNKLAPRLIQPFASTLSKGQEYTFELKCETSENFRVLIQISPKSEAMERQDNIYRKTVTIDPSTTSSSLKILYVNDTYLYNLYEYKIE